MIIHCTIITYNLTNSLNDNGHLWPIQSKTEDIVPPLTTALMTSLQANRFSGSYVIATDGSVSFEETAFSAARHGLDRVNVNVLPSPTLDSTQILPP